MPQQRQRKEKDKHRRRNKSSSTNYYQFVSQAQNHQARLATLTSSLTQSSAFQQLAPLLVLILLPTLFIFLASKTRGLTMSVFYKLGTGIESVGSWLWSSSSSGSSPRGEKKHRKSKLVRTRAEQVALLERSGGDEKDSGEVADDGWYPGLVNISGTYCFMNSTLQALASLTYLQPHINLIHAKAEALDVPTPVIDALKSLFSELNTPHKSYRSLRPTDLIKVLSAQTEGRPNSLFYSREHQDAQELFQVLSECIKNELSAVDKEGLRDHGLKGLGLIGGEGEWRKEIGKSVFDGLTANRRSCTHCGYTEAVMHFALDNWQLAVPRASACHLEECLEEYIKLEYLNDCICRNCSILITYERLKSELIVMQSVKDPSNSKKKNKKIEAKKMEVKEMVERVGKAIKEGRIEDELEGVRMDKVFRLCTRQTMIARPPPVLVLHINRSVHSGYYASKNSVRLIFPEILDLTPYTTSGSLSTVPNHSISTPPPILPRSATPTPGRYAQERERTVYRLASVVCHFGQHSFGHYICYRRKPRSGVEEERWTPPRLVQLEEEEEEKPVPFGFKPTRVGKYAFSDPPPRPGKGWLRISDDSVREVGLETVLAEGSGAFMLYYERAVVDAGIYRGSKAGSTSEETLKPVGKTLGEGVKGVCEVGVGVRGRSEEKKHLEVKVEEKEERKGLAIPTRMGTARIVRNVAAGRRSVSAAASREGSILSVSPPETSLSVGALPRTLAKADDGDDKKSGMPNGHGYHPNGVQKFPLASSTPSRDSSLDQSLVEEEEEMMTASAPAALPSPSPSPTTSPSKKKKKKHKKRMQSPQPQPGTSAGAAAHHTSPVVGLKA